MENRRNNRVQKANSHVQKAAVALGALCFLVAAIGSIAWTAPASADAASPAKTSSPNAESVIDLILRRSPELRSYSAHVVLDIQQLDFPWLHPVLDGQEYYQAPGYTAYNFHDTPSYLQGITRAEGAMGMASRWMRCYNITVRTQPDAYLLHMVPKIRGEVKALDVIVNKKNGNLQHFDWSYQDSPDDSVSLTQFYTTVGGYDVVTLQQSQITRHHIRAKLTGTFDSFQYNVPVPTPTPTPSDPLHQCDN